MKFSSIFANRYKPPIVTSKVSIKQIFLFVAFTFACVLLPVKQSLADITSLTLVAAEGDDAPGTSAGVVFKSTSSPQINNNGEVLISGLLQGPSVTTENDGGLWKYSNGVLELVFREGNPVPGAGPGIVFGSTPGADFNDAGSAYFYAQTIDTNSSQPQSTSYWVGDEVSVSRIVGRGDMLPGLATGESVSTASCRSTLASDYVACIITIAGDSVQSSSDYGYWAGTPGNLQPVIREGDAAPGLPGQTVAGNVSNSAGIEINSNGTLAVSTAVTDGSIVSRILYQGSIGALTPVAINRTSPPGTVNGEQFGSFTRIQLDDADNLLYFAKLIVDPVTGVTTQNQVGAWLYKNGVTTKVIRSGDNAPALLNGEIINFGYLFGDAFSKLNRDGSVLMTTWDSSNSVSDPYRGGARLLGPTVTEFNNQGIWLDSGSGFDLVLRDGDLAPGLTDGSVFNITGGGNLSSNINSSNQIVVRVPLSAPGQNTANAQFGLFEYSDNTLSLLATNFDTFTLDNGESVRLRLIFRQDQQRGLNEAGDTVFRALFDDGIVTNTSANEGIFVMSIASNPPVADAGPDQSIRIGDLVQLDGTASFDDNTPTALLDYQWSVTSYPGSTAPVLTNANTARPSFVADVSGLYTLELVVTDEDDLSSLPDTVLVSNENLPPTAIAGTMQIVPIGTTVQLDGSASFDPENDPLTYFWSISDTPPGSSVDLNNPNLVMPSFIPDVIGSYVLNLVVSDLIGPSAPDTIRITVATQGGYIEYLIMQASNVIDELSPGQLTTGGHQNKLLNFLSQAIEAVQSGNTGLAIKKVEDTIVRTDGCDLRGTPDIGPGNNPEGDYITDCTPQYAAYSWLTQALDELNNL